MCGIIGATKSSESKVRAALATFSYRGPDALGSFGNASISLGHARLSIIDLDSRSTQPFHNAEQDLIIVFNGEIYNYQELRSELERSFGVRFRTTSDTEVLIEGYRVWGRAILPRLRGMFAFGIYDKRDESVFLARDHAGIKPLYYSLVGKQLSFASELKGVVSLLKEKGHAVSIDREAIAQYSVFGYIPVPHTPIVEIQKLERGSWLRYNLKNETVERDFWRPETALIETPKALEDAIRRSVIEHCIADVPVGTFFSGGIDSSLVTAILHEAGMDLATFSIRVSGRPQDEPYFRSIAGHLNVKATIADFGVTEFDELYDYIFDRMDDPIADNSIFPTAFVSQIAAKEVKVVLSGEGGDELFLGYPRSARLSRIGHSGEFLRDTYGHALTTLSSFRGKNHIFSEAAANLGMPAAYYLMQMSPARDNVNYVSWRTAAEQVSKGDPLWFDRDWYLENMLLRKTDMATSYASIEGRVPLLGTELWNAAPHFAAENLAKGGTKAILKDMLAHYIPRELIDRPKSGFGTHLRELFRKSSHLRDDLPAALKTAKELGFRGAGDPLVLVDRYPDYAYSLIALHHSLKNCGLI